MIAKSEISLGLYHLLLCSGVKFCINIFQRRACIFNYVMQPIGADVFSSAYRDTDSLQKKMSLSALVPVTNWNSQGLKLILLFCN